MLIDNSLILDLGLTLTTTGSSTNYIDTVGAAGGQAQISGTNTIQGGYDAYEQLFWEVLVLTSFTGSGGAGTIDFQLWTTSGPVSGIWTTGNGGSAPTAAANVVKLNSTGPIALATLVASGTTPGSAYKYQTRIAQGMQRYVSGFNVVLSTISAGKMESILVPDVDINLT